MLALHCCQDYTTAVRNAYFWPVLIGFLSITSASDLSAQSPSTTAPPPLLAASTPPSVYFLTQGVWLTIRDKTYGFGTGTQLELVEDSGGDSLRVKAGDFKFDVKRGLVTNDMEVAKLAWRTEVEKIKEADQEKAREQEQVDQAVKRREEREAAAREQAAQQAAQWQAYQNSKKGGQDCSGSKCTKTNGFARFGILALYAGWEKEMK